MQLTVTQVIKGHQFAVTLIGTGDEADVTFLRDGVRLGDGRWDAEGFVPGPPVLLPDTDDSEDVYDALARAVRARLAALRAA